MNEAELRRLAEEVRVALEHLVPDDEERTEVDARLQAALRLPPGQAKEPLLDALRSHDATAERLESDHDRIGPPPGYQTALAPLYVCPNRDYSVGREVESDEVIFCPKCGAALDRRG